MPQLSSEHPTPGRRQPETLREPRRDDSTSLRRKVLVLEDEHVVSQLLIRFLNAAGYDALPADDPDSAFVALRRSPIDAVVADVRFPNGRSGLEVLEFMHLDEETRDVPVIVLTGATLSPAEEDIIRRYRAHVFYKPHGFDEIVQFLKTRLGD